MQVRISADVTIHCESFGSDNDPAVVLIMGAMNAGLFWPESFCRNLAKHGLRVIRYDQRDTGRSTKFDFALTPYSLADLARDLIGLTDALGIADFHVVGLSLGGAVGQIAASQYPNRCRTLTLLASTLDSRPYNAAMSGRPQETNALTAPHFELVAYAESMREFVPRSMEESFAATLAGWRHFFGDQGFPETEVRTRVAEAQRLQEGSQSAINHAFAAEVEADRSNYAATIACPTLIIHGTQDRAFGEDHARNSHALIKNSKLIFIQGLGHMASDAEFLKISEHILEHVKIQ